MQDNERDRIETEIGNALKVFFEGRKNPVKRIVVAKDFNEIVKKFLGKSSWEQRDYNQVHEYGVAVAKTMPEIQNGEISFNLIMDRRLFQRLDYVGRLDRMGTFIHEFTHMLDDKLRFDSVGKKGFDSVSKVKKEMLFHNAWVIWQEYHAERNVFEIFEAVRSEKIEFEYTPKLDHLETLKEFLSSLQRFLQENISKFRNWQLTPEKICRLITKRVGDMLFLYAYVFALSDAVAKLEDRVAELDHLDGYRFFSENLPQIHTLLLELYEKRNEYKPELVHQLGSLFDSILKKCGLEIEDATEGYQVKVNDIQPIV